MKTLLFATILTLSFNVFAASAWEKQDSSFAVSPVAVKQIMPVKASAKDDGDLWAKVITVERTDESYDVVVTFGNVNSSQTYKATGFASETGEPTLKQNKDGSFQLTFLVNTSATAESTVSLKIQQNADGEVISVQ